MFKLGRRTLAGLVAVTAMAGGLTAGATAPASAQAASKCHWQIPDELYVVQNNRWKVHTTDYYGHFQWRVFAFTGGGEKMTGRLKLTRFDTSGYRPQVRFSVSWSNNSVGVYSGFIDTDGFVSGTNADKTNGGTARWSLADTVNCVR